MRSPPGVTLPASVKPGATLRFTGICHLNRSQHRIAKRFDQSFWLQVKGMQDIRVLEAAPWWTPTVMLWTIAVGTLLIVAFQVWITLLRQRVTAQTRIISDQIKRESILKERQRIARELHDTLEQALGGLTMLLDNCRLQIKSQPEKGLRSLELAKGMLRHCRKEFRASISELRGGLLEKTSLYHAVVQTIQPLAESCDAKFEAHCSGQERKLRLQIERHILRIASEATSNAVRHGKPRKIRFDLSYTEESLTLSIQNDGLEFSPNDVAETEHFGILGMHERANQIGGTLEINSDSAGTSVILKVPRTNGWNPEEI
ncbi:sensor histidine kinase [Luteolibacter algae]|uniref:Sensor histidine kinase n=1 Tax=Luteolibacter algae TaxID=454151 RepID=A0ABW5DD24_9BACT